MRLASKDKLQYSDESGHFQGIRIPGEVDTVPTLNIYREAGPAHPGSAFVVTQLWAR